MYDAAGGIMQITVEGAMRLGMYALMALGGLFFFIFGLATGEPLFGILWALFIALVVWIVHGIVKLLYNFIRVRIMKRT
jgi:hypothetical protein